MTRFRCSLTVLCCLIFVTAGCAPRAETAVPVTSPPPATATQVATAVPTTLSNPDQPQAVEQPAEAIQITQPGPGSQIANSPLHVTGVADPTFEQTLVVRLLLDDGTVLAESPTIIQADVGQRGLFAVDIPFSAADTARQAFVQVYAASARDGGITHLSSVGVTLANGGADQITTLEPHPERIQISQPALGEAISGGTVMVAGVALASFEQTLVVELLDEAGLVLASQPVTVQAPDVGQPGPFSVELAYQTASSGNGRLVIRDISPAFGGDVHLSSVEVMIAP